MKFGRRCSLAVEVNPDSKGVPQANLVIPSNLTIEFEISRQFLASSQEATFRVYNLNEEHRPLVQKDPYALTEFRAIQFRAGYKDFMPLVFNGFVRHATSDRVGTNVVTTISAYDGGQAMANGVTSSTVASGETVAQTLAKLAKSLPRVSGQPIVGDFPTKNLRAKVLFGNTWSVILQESGNLATIDNGQVKILKPNEAIEAEIPVINSDSGLLGMPRRTPTKLEVDMLFEPRLTIGQLLELDSRLNRIYNGTYKVTGFTHRGVISPAVSGECVSTVSLFFGPDELKLVKANVIQ